MKITTKDTYLLQCLNCRERDTADTREEILQKAEEHLRVGDGSYGFPPRPGLGHSGHKVLITKGEIVTCAE